ncbi:MAG: hypothetical protein KDE63_11975, partial [Novosphingobium sp.]|nr:hypothetical protein [Novosphingobium sp.]
VRLTRGKVTKLNFGAAISRVVRLDLQDEAFNPQSTELQKQWQSGIQKLITILEQEPSTLRLTYHIGKDGKSLASKRLKAVTNTINRNWKKRPGRYRLPIETRTVGAN